MLVVYADTAEEFRQETLVYLRDQHKREERSILSYTTTKGQQAQRARANCVQSIIMDFERLTIAPKKEE